MGTHHTAYHPIDALLTPLIDAVEAGPLPWLQPWQRRANDVPVCRPRLGGGTVCAGLNTLLLWHAGAVGAEYWLTDSQAAALGLLPPVDRGVSILRQPMQPQRGDPVVVYPFPGPQQWLAGDQTATAIRFLQVQDADIGACADRPFYSRMVDRILVPRMWKKGLPSAEVSMAPAVVIQAYIHWARHPTRVRQTGRPPILPDASRSIEMLVTSIGASLLCAELGVVPLLNDDRTEAFRPDWVRILRAETRFAVAAAAAAQEAVDFLVRRAGASMALPMAAAVSRNSLDQHSRPSCGPVPNSSR